MVNPVYPKVQSWRAELDCPRLDRYIADRLTQLSRSSVSRLVKEGRILVNNVRARPSTSLHVGDLIEVVIQAESDSAETYISPEVKVVYEDASILVLDKPAGLTVYPGAGKPVVTLSTFIQEKYPELSEVGEKGRPGIVHRLDKDTSGLMIVARSAEAYRKLVQMFKDHRVKKTYLVLVSGRLEPDKGSIEAPIGRHPARRQLMTVLEGGKPARTSYRVLKYYPAYTLLEAGLETGRTHQIRVHFAAIGHTVAGDRLYGEAAAGLPRQFLHAACLEFLHPVSGEALSFQSPLPTDLDNFLKGLKFGQVSANSSSAD
jgi:23S rRNA pseudouridine1911/1915/1917 synthase